MTVAGFSSLEPVQDIPAPADCQVSSEAFPQSQVLE